MKRRSRGESFCLSNKYNHMVNGNRAPHPEYIDAIFVNVPGKTLSKQGIKLAIKTVLNKYKPAILGIAEPAYEDLKVMHFPGYKLIKGRLNGGKKIRLNVLVKNTLVDYTVDTLTTEVPCVMIKVNGYKYIMFYREWRKDGVIDTDNIHLQEERWENFLTRIRRIKGKVFIFGDANLCYLRDDTDHQRKLGNMKAMLQDALGELGYLQIIKEDTRHQGEHKGLLDHIYTKSLKFVERIYNRNVHGHDHNAIGVRVRQDKPVFRSEVVTTRDLDGAEVDDFERAWHQSNPQEIFASDDIEKQIEVFEYKVLHSMDIVAPEKKFNTRENYAPWVDKQLKAKMNVRDAMRDAAIKSGDWAAFKAKKKEVSRALSEAENAYLSNYLNFSNEKTGWRRLKQVSGLTIDKEKTITLNINGELVSDPEIVAPYMSKFYKTKIEDIVKEVPPDPVGASWYMMEYLKGKSIGSFEFRTVDYRYIKSVIMSLNNVDSVGLDLIPVKVYKKFRRVLTPYIARIVNNCIRESYYPMRYKDGVIVPIPKKSEGLTDVANWRPVVLLPVASRILEGVLSRQLTSYLEGMRLIAPTQHAYRAHKGTGSCWEDLDCVVNKARDEGKSIGVLCTDMTSAFNCVNAACLLPTLRMAGMGNFSCQIIKSYLTGRRNRVKVGNHMSQPVTIHTGSGEGSQISPLLWVVFILSYTVVLDRVKKIITADKDDRRPAHIPRLHPENVVLQDHSYADDVNTSVISSSNANVLSIMEICQDEYAKFFKCLGLKESRGKQQHIIFSKNKNKEHTYPLNNRAAEKEVRLLGVIVSEDWTFETHCTKVIGKVAARIPHIRQIRDHVSRDVLLRVSKSLCCSIYEYQCDIAFQKVGLQRRLQRILNCLLRVVTVSSRMRSVAAMLEETKWANLTITVKYFSIWALQRVLTYQAAEIPYNLVNWEVCRVQTVQTRYRHLQLLWRPRTAAAHNSWLILSCKYYNELHLWSGNWSLEDSAKEDLMSWLKNNNRNGNL